MAQATLKARPAVFETHLESLLGLHRLARTHLGLSERAQQRVPTLRGVALSWSVAGDGRPVCQYDVEIGPRRRDSGEG